MDVDKKNTLFFQYTLKKLKKKLKKIFSSNKKFLLGFSGGIDSTVLLDIISIVLKSYNSQKVQFRAHYVDHTISKNSEIWKKHCEEQCRIRSIDFVSTKIEKNPSISYSEQKLRILRYLEFKKIIFKKEILLTAHHLDDQVETFFLALKRGSGTLGLSGMIKKNGLYGINILRPMISIEKKFINEYAKKYKLRWIQDESNFDLKYDRNFLRIKILPIIRKRWKFFNQSVYRTTKICSQQENLISSIYKKKIKSMISTKKIIDIIKISSMKNFDRIAILRFWLKMNKLHISYKKIGLLWEEMANSKKDNKCCFKIENFCIKKFKNFFYIIPFHLHSIKKKFSILWLKNNKKINLPMKIGKLKKSFKKKRTVYKNKKNTNNKLNIRCPKKNEKILIKINIFPKNSIYLLKEKKKYKIKSIFQKFNIPPWERKYIPLVYYNKILMGAVGKFATKNSKNKKSKKSLEFTWINSIQN
ncbi:tRNA lysidine(34) synthetase TilS [bacterium endosymbiont of Pedicinus badii]|uniref:tRNA lysidine(34) synthetase TilS n=1 Tax=bacterium endosymbiont of Pedicinus badii TaxID=1719126 RepID=UPI0009BAA6FA|nr:tRNA lysidine(34) synthetase TilS [bacterium endosymbiont of Pedicinus badii]OQM33986.1 hypothetical protein AOQ89_01325 [bacterium endosymbiont of Pedicinus badii]